MDCVAASTLLLVMLLACAHVITAYMNKDPVLQNYAMEAYGTMRIFSIMSLSFYYPPFAFTANSDDGYLDAYYFDAYWKTMLIVVVITGLSVPLKRMYARHKDKKAKLKYKRMSERIASDKNGFNSKESVESWTVDDVSNFISFSKISENTFEGYSRRAELSRKLLNANIDGQALRYFDKDPYAVAQSLGMKLGDAIKLVEMVTSYLNKGDDNGSCDDLNEKHVEGVIVT